MILDRTVLLASVFEYHAYEIVYERRCKKAEEMKRSPLAEHTQTIIMYKGVNIMAERIGCSGQGRNGRIK